MPFAPLPESFYEPAADIVARRLLGHFLIRNTPDGPCGGPIVEAEAYLVGDPACHAFKGQSARNVSMFGPAGRAYIYFIYGFHFCFNVVCRPKGIAEAVLVRAIEPDFGEPFMRAHRPAVANRHRLANGPGKLCAALDINRALDGANLCEVQSPVFIARNPGHKKFLADQGPIAATARIGITQAADRKLRFLFPKSPFTSRPPLGG